MLALASVALSCSLSPVQPSGSIPADPKVTPEHALEVWEHVFSGEHVLDATPAADFEPESATVASPASAPAASSWALGRFRFGIMTGAMISQKRNNFSDTDLFLRFLGDTTWQGNPRAPRQGDTDVQLSNVHSQISLTFETIPDVTPGDDFTHSEKALTLEGALDWRIFGWNLDNETDATTGEITYDRLSVGPLVKTGLQTITEDRDPASDLDSVNHYTAFGIRVAEEVRSSKVINPGLFRYLDLTRGTVENFDGERWLFEGVLRANLTQDAQDEEARTWFIGFKANLGSGPDDLRIFIGTDNALQYLASVVEGISGMFASPKSN